MEAVVSFHGLSAGYVHAGKRDKILDSVSGEAARGEIVAVMGRNGTGKSTLLRTMAGLQKPLGGVIYYNGKDISSIPGNELAKIAGYISTEPVRAAGMSVYDLVSLGRIPYTGIMGNLSAADIEAVNDAMEKASVIPLRHRYLTELSDGERQKAMIARVLAQNTAVMLLDEPAAFLDAGAKYEIMHLLHRLAEEEKRTIIYTSHDIEIAVRHSDLVWLVSDGGITAGAPEDLMASGAFSRLFESDYLKLSPETGTFLLREEKKGDIFIEGAGNMLYWTERAVTRAGYAISAGKTIPYIKIIGGNRWRIISGEAETECTTFYQLVRMLSAIT